METLITALIVLVPIVSASTVIYMLVTNNRLAKKTASLMDGALSLEKELKVKSAPALYIEDTWCDETRPLSRAAYTLLQEIKDPTLADRYEMTASWLREPDLLADLRMVLETSRGLYYLYLDEVPDDLSEAAEVQVQFDSVVCGQPLEIYAWFAEFKGFRLGVAEYKGDMSPGDKLNLTYTLIGGLV